MSDKEIWKDIEGYEGFYQVSNLGRVKSLGGWFGCVKRKDKIRKLTKNRYGYPTVQLHKNKITKMQLVHRLVAKSFIPNTQNLKEINHIDGNKENNCVENLEWTTRSNNIKHAFETGLETAPSGVLAYRAKFSNEEIQYIRRVYIPRDKEYGARALARKYNVHRTTIEKILRKKTYAEDNP